jgi:hypothetical protein
LASIRYLRACAEVLLLQRLLAGDTAGWEAAQSLRA